MGKILLYLTLMIVISTFAFTSQGYIASAGNLSFDELPHNLKRRILEVRERCQEVLGEQYVAHLDLLGITEMQLADETRGFIVDFRWICNEPVKAASCDTGGCDLLVYQKLGDNWVQNLNIHSRQTFISHTLYGPKLVLIVASIDAEDPRCHPKKNIQYSTSMSCDVIFRYRDGKWISNVIK